MQFSALANHEVYSHVWEELALSSWSETFNPSNSYDFIGNSPYCLLYNSCDVHLENLELDQPVIP